MSATRKMRGYSLVMKPDRSSGKKTLKIYGVYEDDGGKACIQRVKEVNNDFKDKIREILAAGGIPENERNVEKVGNVVPVNEGKNLENELQNFDETEKGANIDLPNSVQTQNISHSQKEFKLLNDEDTTDNIKPNFSNNTTELAIATALENIRILPDNGGKTQKRLPKRKRSIFSIKK